METITPQKISGFLSISAGPGVTPRAISAPNKIAVVPEPGMPKVSMGTKEPVEAALLAVSGADRPLIEPLPNSARSSDEAKLRSVA